MNSPRRGVTMVELLIVVAILGIIGAMALPMFSVTSATKLRAAASVLAADLDATRAESIAHGEDPRVIVFDTATNTWRLAASSDPATAITHPDSGLPYTLTLGRGGARQLDGVTIDSYALDATGETDDNKLGFLLYGQLDQPTDATITLAAGGATITLTINATSGEVAIGPLN